MVSRGSVSLSGGKWLAIAGLGLLAAGCQSPSEVGCTRELQPGVGVVVRDASTGAAPERAQAATVTVQDGAYTDTLSFAGWEDADPSRGALFIHNAERAGTYTVRVALSQYQPWVQDGVQVLGQQCHVNPAVVVAELDR